MVAVETEWTLQKSRVAGSYILVMPYYKETIIPQKYQPLSVVWQLNIVKPCDLDQWQAWYYTPDSWLTHVHWTSATHDFWSAHSVSTATILWPCLQYHGHFTFALDISNAICILKTLLTFLSSSVTLKSKTDSELCFSDSYLLLF
jgi:hypothetical protein